MTRIGSLVDPAVMKQMLAIAAVHDGDAPARPRSTDDVDIDPNSEAMIEAACFDCGTNILIEPSVPLEYEGKARRFACADCAQVRINKALTEQRRVQAIRRTRVAKHQPRTTDNIDHPVTITKENDMTSIDLNTMSDAQIGELMRKGLMVLEERKIVQAKPVVEAERAAADVEFKEAVAVEQEARRSYFDEGFTFLKIEVPDLDLRDVSSTNEIVSGKVRSPYNKMRHRNGEPLLVYPDKDGVLPEGTPATIGIIIAEHQRFKALAAGTTPAPTPAIEFNVFSVTDTPPMDEPGGNLPNTQPVTVVAAVVDGNESAVDRAVAALASLFDETVEEAMARLG